MGVEVIVMRFPIGIDNFGEIIEDGYVYVDKSLFIEEVIESHGKVQLITRPRRFGKTLNMSTLAHFFNDRQDNRALFKGLNIESRPCFDQCGSRPVIFLSFKNLKAMDYDSFLELYQIMMSRLFNQYSYIEDQLSALTREPGRSPAPERKTAGYCSRPFE